MGRSPNSDRKLQIQSQRQGQNSKEMSEKQNSEEKSGFGEKKERERTKKTSDMFKKIHLPYSSPILR